MKTLRHRCLLTLALFGLLVGQWFAVVHATQHELSNDDTRYCQTCAIAHASGGVPAAPQTPLLAVLHDLPPPARPRPLLATRAYTRPPSRAPPRVSR